MRTIRSEIRTKATPGEAYEAWADPAKLAGFFVDRAEGEVKKGSTYTWFFDAFKYQFPYEVVEAVPGEKLSLAANMPGFPPGLLEITIHKDGGETIIRLVNSGFSDASEFDEMFDGMASGWEMVLATLKHYLERAYGRPRADLLVMRPAKFEYADLMPHFHAPGEWLGIATGRELVVTKREILLEWPEAQGVIGLKAFSGKNSRQIGLQPNAWGENRPRLEGLMPKLEASLEKLAARL